MAAAAKPLNLYPDAWGAHHGAVAAHYGPASYVQITLAAATAPTNGDQVLASEFGMKNLDFVNDSLTDDGIFQLWAIPTAPSAPVSGASPTSFRLMWIANKTGTFGGQAQTFGQEAAAGTNLSAFIARLFAIGI